nr:hypothetical protein BaRGS_016480 [Batillaria attramentaria]
MKSMNTTMSLLLLVIVLLTRSLSQEYKPSAFAIQPVLTPRVPQPQAQTPPGFSQTAPAPPPAPAPAPAPASASALVPAPDPAPAADSSPPSSPEEPRRTLGTAGKDILRKFDDYLFKNLEDAYYRLT